MVAFLLTVVVIGALIYTGYRLNIYLYTCGAMEVTANQMQPVVGETFGIRPLRAVEMEERDYGLRYARVGLLFIAAFLLVLVVGLVIAIFAVL
jgi:hypothetical protein